MDGVKISVNNEEEEKKPAKKRGRPRKAASKEKPKPKKEPNKKNPKKSMAEARNESASIKKPTEKKSSKKSSSILTILVSVVVTALLVGVVMYAWQKRDGEKDINSVRQEARNVRMDFEQRLTQLKNKLTGVETENQKLKTTTQELEEQAKLLEGAKKEYESPELGFKFLYPAVFGDIALNYSEGSSGKKFVGTFSKNNKLVFSGVSSDYIEKATSTSVSFSDSQGYLEERDRYYFQNIGADESKELEFVPTKTIDTDAGLVVVVNKSSFSVEPEEEGLEEIVNVDIGENMGAVLNLENEDYSGLVFENMDFGILPPESFEDILESIDLIN